MKHIKLSQPPDTRRPTSEDDWGDVLTIGLHLKSRDPNSKDQWAVYMGLNKVGIMPSHSFTITHIIQYDTPEAMHAIWILD
jgi:hypothetical protein